MKNKLYTIITSLLLVSTGGAAEEVKEQAANGQGYYNYNMIPTFHDLIYKQQKYFVDSRREDAIVVDPIIPAVNNEVRDKGNNLLKDVYSEYSEKDAKALYEEIRNTENDINKSLRSLDNCHRKKSNGGYNSNKEGRNYGQDRNGGPDDHGRPNDNRGGNGGYDDHGRANDNRGRPH